MWAYGHVAAIASWAKAQYAANPREGIIILGDTNSSENPPHPFTMTEWFDVFTGSPIRSTHVSGKGLYDRIVVSPNLAAKDVVVGTLPFGQKPNQYLVRTWTDHCPVTATVQFK
jgi:hypothetical protein